MTEANGTGLVDEVTERLGQVQTQLQGATDRLRTFLDRLGMPQAAVPERADRPKPLGKAGVLRELVVSMQDQAEVLSVLCEDLRLIA